MGFEISCSLRDGLTEGEFDKFTDDFIEEAIETNNLIFGGGGDSTRWEGYICHENIYQSPTENDREMIRFWLSDRQELIDFSIGQLIDAWHD